MKEDLGDDKTHFKTIVSNPSALFRYNSYSQRQFPLFLRCYGYNGSYPERKLHTNSCKRVLPAVGMVTKAARKYWSVNWTLHMTETVALPKGYETEIVISLYTSSFVSWDYTYGIMILSQKVTLGVIQSRVYSL